MKYGIASDLHLEFWRKHWDRIFGLLNDADCDVILNAGDWLATADYKNLEDSLTNIKKPMIFVKGNHDYYGHPLDSMFFEKDEWVAASLWTNFWNNPLNELVCQSQIADFGQIFECTPSAMSNLNAQHANFINNSKKQLVMTHFPPTIQSLHPRFHASNLNSYFVNNQDFLLQGRKLWVHGHTHTDFDYIHEPSGCRVICNPLGYPFERNVKDYKVVIVEL